MSFANNLYALRSASATMPMVANAIDGLASGRMSDKVVTATGSETVDSEGVIFVNNSTNITRTLPAPSTCQGKIFTFIKVSGNTATCTIDSASGSVFSVGDNVLRGVLDYRIYVSNGSNYYSLDSENFSAGGTSWTPAYGGNGSMTWTGVTTVSARWWPLGTNLRFVTVEAVGTVGGTLNNTLTVSLPFSVAGSYQSLPCILTQGSFMTIATAWCNGGTTVNIRKIGDANYTATAVVFGMQGIVRI